MKKTNIWAWIIFILGILYFFVPLVATLDFSLRAQKDVYPSLAAYRFVFSDPEFYTNFGSSLLWSLLTMVVSLLLIVPTTYWVHLRLPNWRPAVEFVTLMPFVVPAVVLTFGMIRLYCCDPLPLVNSPILLIAGYTILSFPYMFRAVDAGLRAIDVRTLTEAAQSLGAGWPTILFQVIFPNLRVALLSGVFLTFAIVIGEFTFASLLSRPAFGPYMEFLGAQRAYEPAALALISFALSWGSIGIIQYVGRGKGGEANLAGAR